jgi:hypothetical protein
MVVSGVELMVVVVLVTTGAVEVTGSTGKVVAAGVDVHPKRIVATANAAATRVLTASRIPTSSP